jgi:hypothetical protein
MARVAKTARPALGVWRTSKRGEIGALAGTPFVVGEGCAAEELDDGREMLELVCDEAEAEDELSTLSIFDSRLS